MINLAEAGATCDCGSVRLVPWHAKPGELVICGACARTFRVAVALAPVPPQEIEEYLSTRDSEQALFEGVRAGVPPSKRHECQQVAREWFGYLAFGGVLGVVAVIVVRVFA